MPNSTGKSPGTTKIYIQWLYLYVVTRQQMPNGSMFEFLYILKITKLS